jgi:hypothetical protein
MIGLNEFDINRILSEEAREAGYYTDINTKRMAVAICKAVAKAIAANNRKIDMDIKVLVRVINKS